MNYNNTRIHKTIFLIFSLLSLLGAQNKNVQEKTVQPIAVTEIVSKLDADIQTITKLQNDVNKNSETALIKKEFAQLRIEIEKYKKDMEKIDFKSITANKLADLQKRLEGFDNKMISYQQQLNKEIDYINAGLLTISSIENVWQVTYKSRSKQKIPPSLIIRINQIIKTSRATKISLKNELDSLLNLQNSISNTDLYVKKQLLTIKKVSANIKKRIFQISNQPIWRVKIDSSLLSQIKLTTKQKKESFIAYFNMYPMTFVTHFFIFLFFLLLFLYIYFRASKKKIASDDVNITTIFTRYPISAAILTTCLLTPFIHTHSPTVIGELNRLILFIPIIRLLPLLFLREIKMVTISMITLFILYSLSNLLIGDFNTQRIITALLIVITLIGLFFLNRKRTVSSQIIMKTNWAETIRIASYLGTFLTLVSFISIIFGAVSFARLLFGAVLNSAYLAIILLTGDKIVESLGETIFNSALMQKSKFIMNNRALIIQRYKTMSRVLFIILWLGMTINLFGISDAVINVIVLTFTSSANIGKLSISLGSIAAFVLAIYLTFKVSKLVRAVLDEDVLPRISLPKGMPSTISTMTHYTILAAGFLFAMSAAGMNWGNLAIIIGSLGVGIGFGLQNLVNNFVSGLILIFERPISIGDVVEVGTLMGTVKRIGIRSSTIRTFNESEVIVPNSLLVSQELINWTLSDRQRRLDIPVGVAYGTDPQKVIAILQEVAEAHPKVKDYPKPFITFDGFGDSSLNFLLRIWAADFSEGLSIKTEVSIQIYKRFKEENIKIPFPQHDIHIIPQKTEKGSEKQREDNKIFKDDTINGFDESVKDDDED